MNINELVFSEVISIAEEKLCVVLITYVCFMAGFTLLPLSRWHYIMYMHENEGHKGIWTTNDNIIALAYQDAALLPLKCDVCMYIGEYNK